MTEYCLICNGVAILDAATQEVQYRNRVAAPAVEPLARIAMKYGRRVQVMGTHWMIAMSSMVKHGPHMHGGKVVRMRGRRKMCIRDRDMGQRTGTHGRNGGGPAGRRHLPILHYAL